MKGAKMNNMWTILGQAEDQSPRVTQEPVGESQTAETVAVDPNQPAQRTPPPKSPLIQFLPLILIFVVMYLLLFRGPRKKQQQHKQMVQSLKKNDRVRTIGGIFGTVVDVKGDELVLKVDEANNTKIRVASSAIGKNLSQDMG
jgi:preprotein translocase subunit YajC